MTLLDLLIILTFLLLAAFAKIPVTLLTVAVLVAIICVERLAKGERL